MVNAFDKVLRRASWRQSRAEPLEDPNDSGMQGQNDVVDPNEPLPFVFPHSSQPHHTHFSSSSAAAAGASPPVPGGGAVTPIHVPLPHRASFHPDVVTSPTNLHSTTTNNTKDANNLDTEKKEPLRRVMTRADTKISLRKSKKDSRRIFVNLPLPSQDLDSNGNPKVTYGSNRIKTAKYSAWDFLPKNLFEQFRRVANMFFLFMAILQLTPIFTVGSPFLTVFPLCFVVGVTAIKDGFEDYKRHVEDRNYNQRLVLQLKNVPNYNYPNAGKDGAGSGSGGWWSNIRYVFHSASKKTLRALHLKKKATRELQELDLDDLPQIDDNESPKPNAIHQQHRNFGQRTHEEQKDRKSAEFIKEQWANIRVGDIIMLKNNQPVPADAIIIATSEAEGSCFIETKDLDGETNLKTRVSLHETSKYNTPRRCSRLRCFIDMEPVNANLYSCNGALTMVSRRRPEAGSHGARGHDRHHSSHPDTHLHRYSTYSASITSSMLSSPRHSLEEDAEQQASTSHSPAEAATHGPNGDPDRPAQGGTVASEYARMHRPSSRSRSSAAIDSNTVNMRGGNMAEVVGDQRDEICVDNNQMAPPPPGKHELDEQDEEGPAPPPKPFGHRMSTFINSKRNSLHRSQTRSSVGGASELAKNVLRNQHLQQSVSRNNTLVRKKTTTGQADKYREKSIPVDINNMLLRGHVIRNSHWVIAVVVATGTETKIMLNSGETPSKRSRIEKTMNMQVAINFAILVVLCIIVAVGSSINDREWRGTSAGQLWMPQTRGVTLAGVVTFFSSLIIFQNIIPISLYISIEFVKTFQAYFIWQDTDMYDRELDQFCKPKTWNLTDDLGQVEYVFSDKTGTLTRNVMEFKKCTINGKIYGNNAVAGKTDGERGQELMQRGDEEATGGAARPATTLSNEEQEKQEKDKVLKEYDRELHQIFEPTYVDAPELLSFADPSLLRDLTGKSSPSDNSNSGSTVHYGGLTKEYTHDGSGSQNIRDFLTLLALCHTVVIEHPEEEIEDDEDDDFGMYEEGQSPDQSMDNDSNAGALDEHGRFKSPGSPDNADRQQHQNSLGGVFGKLRQKAEARGLGVPGAASNISTGTARARSTSNATNNPMVDDGKPKPTLIYRAESPDEAALVAAAKNVGFAFVSRGAVSAATDGGDQANKSGGAAKPGTNSRQNINVNFLGRDYTYEQLDVIKFNSTRKRQTVIVREPKELGGKIILMTKGADNVIYERLSKEPKSDEEARIRDQTERDIETFSNIGLRTLTLAHRILDQATYDDWAQRYAEAGKALDDRARKVDEVAEEIERDLTLLGATAIEDKLQDGVPDAIASLREAGIKVWVLTGDKLETAINIGFASRLLEKNMKLEIMRMGRKETPEAVLARFKTLVNAVLQGKTYREATDVDAGQSEKQPVHQQRQSQPVVSGGDKAEVVEGEQEREASSSNGHGAPPTSSWNEKNLPPSPISSAQARDDAVQDEEEEEEEEEDEDDEAVQHALIVDGAALKVLLDDPDARKDLIRLSDECYSVICCRASPLQKALVVELIRRGKKTVCLAIGDGANDVSMIQAANIGVGIAGQEGMQAAMASDYSITQFRFVKKLVLVHGHWGYMRIAEMILNFFFKNIIWVGAVLWFQIYCGFSAYIFYDYTFVSLYNLMFTAVPVLVLGATDQDLTAPYVLRFPGVYRLGILQKRYTQWRFVIYLLDGLWQSAVVFWFWRAVYDMNILNSSGIDSSLLEFSTSVAISNIIIASLYVGMHTYHWTWLMHFAVWGSIVFLVLLIVIYGLFYASPIHHVAFALFAKGPFWFTTFLCIIAALLLRYTALFVISWWFPDDVHLVRGIMLAEKLEARRQGNRWTGYGDDGMQPVEQSKEEKAILEKEDRENEEKAVAKAIAKDLKAAQKEGRHPRDEEAIRQEVVAHILAKRERKYGKPQSDVRPSEPDLPAIPYSGPPAPMIHTSDAVDPHQDQYGGAHASDNMGDHNTLVPGSTHSTTKPSHQQLEQIQRHYFAVNAEQNGDLKPDDPKYRHSKRLSSYNHLTQKEAALPPVPSPPLPSLPPSSSGHPSTTSLRNVSQHHLPPPAGGNHEYLPPSQ